MEVMIQPLESHTDMIRDGHWPSHNIEASHDHFEMYLYLSSFLLLFLFLLSVISCRSMQIDKILFKNSSVIVEPKTQCNFISQILYPVKELMFLVNE